MSSAALTDHSNPVVFQLELLLSRHAIPDAHRAVLTAAHDVLAIRRKRNQGDS